MYHHNVWELAKRQASTLRSLFVRRRDGEDYEPSSLRMPFSSIERHLKKNNYTKIINDKEFELFRKCYRLNNRSWRKLAEGTRTKPLWQSLTRKSIYCTKIICLEFPLVSHYWILFGWTTFFGMRGCQEHRDLCWWDVKQRKDPQGNEYL